MSGDVRMYEIGENKFWYYLDLFEDDNLIYVNTYKEVSLTKKGRKVAVEQGFV